MPLKRLDILSSCDPSGHRMTFACCCGDWRLPEIVRRCLAAGKAGPCLATASEQRFLSVPGANTHCCCTVAHTHTLTCDRRTHLACDSQRGAALLDHDLTGGGLAVFCLYVTQPLMLLNVPVSPALSFRRSQSHPSVISADPCLTDPIAGRLVPFLSPTKHAGRGTLPRLPTCVALLSHECVG